MLETNVMHIHGPLAFLNYIRFPCICYYLCPIAHVFCMPTIIRICNNDKIFQTCCVFLPFISIILHECTLFFHYPAHNIKIISTGALSFLLFHYDLSFSATQAKKCQHGFKPTAAGQLWYFPVHRTKNPISKSYGLFLPRAGHGRHIFFSTYDMWVMLIATRLHLHCSGQLCNFTVYRTKISLSKSHVLPLPCASHGR